ALISLRAVQTLHAIHKLAIFLPPIFLNGVPTDMVDRYEKEIAEGRAAAALVTGMMAGQMGPAIFNYIPRGWLESLVGMGIKSEEKKGSGDYPPMKVLAST